MVNMVLVYVLLTAVVGLIFADYLRRKIRLEPAGNEKMQEISEATRAGAMAFLFREYKWWLYNTCFCYWRNLLCFCWLWRHESGNNS